MAKRKRWRRDTIGNSRRVHGFIQKDVAKLYVGAFMAGRGEKGRVRKLKIKNRYGEQYAIDVLK